MRLLIKSGLRSAGAVALLSTVAVRCRHPGWRRGTAKCQGGREGRAELTQGTSARNTDRGWGQVLQHRQQEPHFSRKAATSSQLRAGIPGTWALDSELLALFAVLRHGGRAVMPLFRPSSDPKTSTLVPPSHRNSPKTLQDFRKTTGTGCSLRNLNKERLCPALVASHLKMQLIRVRNRRLPRNRGSCERTLPALPGRVLTALPRSWGKWAHWELKRIQ